RHRFFYSRLVVSRCDPETQRLIPPAANRKRLRVGFSRCCYRRKIDAFNDKRIVAPAENRVYSIEELRLRTPIPSQGVTAIRNFCRRNSLRAHSQNSDCSETMKRSANCPISSGLPPARHNSVIFFSRAARFSEGGETRKLGLLVSCTSNSTRCAGVSRSRTNPAIMVSSE